MSKTYGNKTKRDDFDREDYKKQKKQNKPLRKNKEERVIESQMEMFEAPRNAQDITQLIKEGNEFYGDCECGVPLTIHRGMTKDAEIEYSFSCPKCSKKWTMNELIDG